MTLLGAPGDVKLPRKMSARSPFCTASLPRILTFESIRRPSVRAARARQIGATALALALLQTEAHASFLHGESLDTLADVMSWVVIVLVPIAAIVAFWLVHILPEKIAEKRHHPQAEAIKVLCLLSLFFGGLLWPLAWLWAYSKPVLYKMAYGTDVVEHKTKATTVEKGAKS